MLIKSQLCYTLLNKYKKRKFYPISHKIMLDFSNKNQFTVIDLFSGAGGMSYGFHAHPQFKIIGAIDAQIGKPSLGKGVLDCNKTYEKNIGLKPYEFDLSKLNGDHLKQLVADRLDGKQLDVLLACPPCTGFSRTNPKNHIIDDTRNSLVRRVSNWVNSLRPKVIIMENARELIKGNFKAHFWGLVSDLESLNYTVSSAVHLLDCFGLPQRRERALVIAVMRDLQLHTLEEIWKGYQVCSEAVTVRRAIESLQPVVAGEVCRNDPMHISPRQVHSSTRRRLQLIPKDGGSWIDLKDCSEADLVLTPAMKRIIKQQKFGSHPDVYGRLWWDRPAITIKRECAHVGNGRYCHPDQDRQLTVREMAILQGFPKNYQFVSSSLSNMYRHIGDAVPPLISYQLAWTSSWILTGVKPKLEQVILPNTHLSHKDIEPDRQAETLPLLELLETTYV